MSKIERNILEYGAMLSLLLMSGTVYFYRSHATISLLLYMLFCIYFHYKYNSITNRKSKNFAIIYVTYICLNFLILNTFSNINRVIPYIVFAIGSYLVLSKLTYATIVKRLVKTTGVLAVISIIVYESCNMGLLGINVIEAMGNHYITCYGHTIGWYMPFERLAGLYWEPGAYQIVLNTCLFVAVSYFDTIKDLFSKENRIYLFFIILALIMTQSTTGYMTFLFIVAWAGYKFWALNNRRNLITLFLSIAIIAVTANYVQNSEAVQTKLAQSESDSRSSYTIRYTDNLALIQMINEKPLMGWSVGSKAFRDRSMQLDNETSSNGDLFFIAIFGIPFFLYVLHRCYKNSRSLDIPPIVYVSYFVFMNIGECFLYYPLVFLFLIEKSNHDKYLE